MEKQMKNSSGGEYTLKRRVKILEMLDLHGQLRINELSEIFNVSQVTIRNDLTHLEEKGLLIRTRGGGIKNERVSIDYHLKEKAKRNLLEKQAIGKKTIELIHDNDTIILDSGTTTLEVAKNLAGFKNLTVITNALNIISQLIHYSNIKVIVLGGDLRNSSLSMIGPIADVNIRNYYCDKLIMGVDSINSQHGISTPTIEEAHLNRLMIDISKEVVVVTDSSKFFRRSFAFIAPITKINTIVTDSNIPKSDLQNLQSANIRTIIVDV
jgi:DeoR family transcriptional regulator of aga operon